MVLFKPHIDLYQKIFGKSIPNPFEDFVVDAEVVVGAAPQTSRYTSLPLSADVPALGVEAITLPARCVPSFDFQPF